MIAIKRQVVNVDDEVTFVAKNKKEIESVCLHNHMLSWLEEHAEPFVESWMNQRTFYPKKCEISKPFMVMAKGSLRYPFTEKVCLIKSCWNNYYLFPESVLKPYRLLETGFD